MDDYSNILKNLEIKDAVFIEKPSSQMKSKTEQTPTKSNTQLKENPMNTHPTKEKNLLEKPKEDKKWTAAKKEEVKKNYGTATIKKDSTNPCVELEEQCLKTGNCKDLKDARISGLCDQEYGISTTQTTNQNEQDYNSQNQMNKQIVGVPANEEWHNTGIMLRAGEKVTITASGTVKIAGSDPGQSPEGETETVPDNVAKLLCPSIDKKYSLIAKIGAGDCFYIGSSKTFQVDQSGQFYLSVNDRKGLFGDNSGSWTVEVKIE